TAAASETAIAPTLIPAGNYTPTANTPLYAVYKKTTTASSISNEWDFTGTWTIDETWADANLVLDDEASGAKRFNYAPAVANAALTKADGTPVPDVAGLLFDTAGKTGTPTARIRLRFQDAGTSVKLVQLNGTDVKVTIPANTGDIVTVVALTPTAGSLRGFSVTGGTLNSASSENVTAGGLLATDAEGKWVYDVTASTFTIVPSGGGMNVRKITVGSASVTSYNSNPDCNATSITEGVRAAEAVSVSYTDIVGRPVNASAKGIVIVKTIYSDGSTKTEKLWK
ncbi:MAG: hypothetical protein LBD45_09695, partial [Bacteroidales bacterium]|nr:hypothetical protein [Bacteroidales bacterium]